MRISFGFIRTRIKKLPEDEKEKPPNDISGVGGDLSSETGVSSSLPHRAMSASSLKAPLSSPRHGCRIRNYSESLLMLTERCVNLPRKIKLGNPQSYV